ncbi:hypothetical protein ACIGZJ_15330 [Kitasatospora sp. NPDC052868]|uniref:hypothetical protein n=1 Tax=Kitasatospora sp. NPDC052868 TaxID=3364060 RepID=UPI0037C9003E
MANLDGLTLQVQPAPDLDPEDLAELTGLLRAELLDEVDVAAADPVDSASAPDHAKGLETLVGWLVVQFGTIDTLRAVVGAVRSWAGRTNRAVEVSYGGDVLKLSGATSEQQEKIINDWLARHTAVA